MARKATDLLDVFRFSGDGGDGEGGGRRAPSRKKNSAKQAVARRKPRRRFEGITLNRRQVWLASSAIGLLLLLSFFLGLATGSPGADDSNPALERRVAKRFWLRARLPYVDPTTSKPADVPRIAKVLTEDYRIRRQNVRMRRAGGELVIDIGPFPSRAEARSWLERSGLELWRIHMQDPFRFPEYVASGG